MVGVPDCQAGKAQKESRKSLVPTPPAVIASAHIPSSLTSRTKDTAPFKACRICCHARSFWMCAKDTRPIFLHCAVGTSTLPGFSRERAHSTTLLYLSDNGIGHTTELLACTRLCLRITPGFSMAWQSAEIVLSALPPADAAASPKLG